MTRLGVVVPAFRPDTARLETYLRALVDELDPETVRVELDDPDSETLRRLSALDVPVVELNAVPYRRGKGAAITAGFEALESELDWLAFADADGSTSPSEFARVVGALTDSDVSVGSRRHPQSHVLGHQTFARRFLGDGFSWLARRLLDAKLYDYQCGAKAITADAWRSVREHLYEPGFSWDVELLAMAAALALDITEVPIEWEDKPGSTVSPVWTTLSMGKALLVARHRAKRLQNSPLHDVFARDDEIALVNRK